MRKDCVEILTAPTEKYEAREEVMAAERKRESRAFMSRLARLRAQEEARFIARVRASTITKAAPVFSEDEVPENEALEVPLETQVALSSEAPPDDFPRKSAPAPPENLVPAPPVLSVKPVAKKPSLDPETSMPGMPRTLGDAPTPELYLRGARCLLSDDRRHHNQKLLEGKKSAARSELGALALLLVDGDGLSARIEAELNHRGLAKTGPACAHPTLRPVVLLLRSLVGQAARSGRDADRYGRGLLRLGRELEVRAGLPRAP